VIRVRMLSAAGGYACTSIVDVPRAQAETWIAQSIAERTPDQPAPPVVEPDEAETVDALDALETDLETAMIAPPETAMRAPAKPRLKAPTKSPVKPRKR
jgi:hypothetical protein